MEVKEIEILFKKLGIEYNKPSDNLEDYDEEKLYEYGRPLRKGERIIVKTI